MSRSEIRTGTQARRWLTNAPGWALSLFMGLWFAGFMTVFGLVRGDGWPAAVISGAIGGVIFGAVMGPFLQRQRRRQREALGAPTAAVERAAGRAAWRGPVPADPEVRAAARRLIDHQLGEMRRERGLAVTMSTLLVALAVCLAITESPWWLAGGVVFVAMLAGNLFWPHRLRRRRAQLLPSE